MEPFCSHSPPALTDCPALLSGDVLLLALAEHLYDVHGRDGRLRAHLPVSDPDQHSAWAHGREGAVVRGGSDQQPHGRMGATAVYAHARPKVANVTVLKGARQWLRAWQWLRARQRRLRGCPPANAAVATGALTDPSPLCR
jgi:hypothetical protein